MSYSKIVTLRQMRPAYNIKEESDGEWKLSLRTTSLTEFCIK